MANGEALIYQIPQEIIDKAGMLILILQALGGIIIFYIIFNVINTIINTKRNKKIDAILSNLEEIKVILMKK